MNKRFGYTLLLIIVILVISGGIAIFQIKPRAESITPLAAGAVRPGPPHFLYALYGGDQGFVKDEGYTKKDSANAFKGPLAITVTPKGKIFVADTGHSLIQAFNENGVWVASFGQGTMATPTGIISWKEKLYITDPNLKKIFVYGEDGKELPLLLDNKRLAIKGGKEGEIIRPSNIQVGSDNLFYITDIANQCVIVLDEQGTIIRSFGSAGTADGKFQYPNALYIGKDGKVYVSDSNNGRIQIFNKEGKFLTKITGMNSKLGPMNLPRGIAVNDEGVIFVVDVLANTVHVFDDAGIELWLFGEMGTGNGQFNFPNGLFIDTLGHIYVTDRENNRVQVFGYE